MLSQRDKYSPRFQNAANFTTQLQQITRMMQHLPAEHDMKATVGKRQFFTFGFLHDNVQMTVLSQLANRSSSHQQTGIGLNSGSAPAIAGQRIGGDSPASANV